MWIAGKNKRWMINTDDIHGFILQGDRTIIMFSDGNYLDYRGEALIPIVIMGIERIFSRLCWR